MKKVLALLTVVCVICIAGTALASVKSDDVKRPVPHRMERPMPPRGHEAPMSPRKAHRMSPKHRKGHPNFTPDMPQEIREKSAELAKLRVDLEEAMTRRPLNKEKALEVHAKMQKVRQEIEAWRFAKKLDRIEARQKGHEDLRHRIPPEPEPETETEESED